MMPAIQISSLFILGACTSDWSDASVHGTRDQARAEANSDERAGNCHDGDYRGASGDAEIGWPPLGVST